MKSETSVFQPEAGPLRICILVYANASIMCVASAIDPLRAANRIVGERRFDFHLVSDDGLPVETTCGLPVAVEAAFDPDMDTDVLIVIGGFGTRLGTRRPLLAAIRKVSRTARLVGGVEAGSWVLGHAGLLDGRSATTHWEDLEDFAEAFPRTEIRADRYVIDGPVVTAGGASPTFDLMLHLVQSRLGMAVALDVASIFIYDQTRAASDAQPLVSLGRLSGYDPRLAKAIRLMESHIENPLTTAAVARQTGISTRTLEMLFRQRIDETPGAYGLRLRLNAARRLVLDTSEPMAVIAARTGFASAAAFSRAFTKTFGRAPVRMRRG